MANELDHYGNCPKCGMKWGYPMTKEFIEEHGEFYGPPYMFSKLIGIEYPEKYDGVWEWKCPGCDTIFPQFPEGW